MKNLQACYDNDIAEMCPQAQPNIHNASQDYTTLHTEWCYRRRSTYDTAPHKYRSDIAIVSTEEHLRQSQKRKNDIHCTYLFELLLYTFFCLNE